MTWWLAFGVKAALACQCRTTGATLELVAPPDGAADVPNNAGVWLLARHQSDALAEGFELRTDPPLGLDTLVDDSRLLAGNGGAFLSLSEPVPAGTQVSVWRPSDPDSGPLLSWTAGDRGDEEPPTWSGRYDVERARERGRALGAGPSEACDELYEQSFVLEEAADDRTAAGSLVVFLEARRVGPDLWGTLADPPWVGGAEPCPRSTWVDPTIDEHWHRRYDVQLMDLAGNVLEGQRVGTAGCSTVSLSWPGAQVLLLVLGFRRRRPALASRS